jgi:hypothetical protein
MTDNDDCAIITVDDLIRIEEARRAAGSVSAVEKSAATSEKPSAALAEKIPLALRLRSK